MKQLFSQAISSKAKAQSIKFQFSAFHENPLLGLQKEILHEEFNVYTQFHTLKPLSRNTLMG